MIYTTEENRYLEYSTPLIEYIKSKHLYINENLIYTKKYSDGTFSITNPTEIFTNCDFINGYPHFHIPLSKCIEEIEFFISDGRMYDNNFYIRYGDTHPHKCIPKLAQIRNLVIENSLSNMIGQNVKSFYGFGDISLKSLKDFIEKYHINITADKLFVMLVNNNVSNDILRKLEEYDLSALKQISEILRRLKLVSKEFLIESKLYTNQELYNSLKNSPNFLEELKENGELKYSLQELMFINSLLDNNDDVLINIIGANQSSHVLKVEELLKGNYDLRSRFLTYEICRNADERQITLWSEKLNKFIEKNNLKINGDNIDYQDLLKILMIINSNDVIIDYDRLDKHANNIRKFTDIVTSVDSINDKKIINSGNDLIYKMALVCYNLNRSIEMGNQSNFYRYLVGIVNEYENKKNKYSNIQGLYKDFLIKCLDRLGYKKNDKIKELKK